MAENVAHQRPRWSIRTMWSVWMLSFIGLMALVGCSALALIGYQGTTVAAATEETAARTSLLARISMEVQEGDEAVGEVIYGLGDPETLPDRWQELADLQDRVNWLFADLEQLAPSVPAVRDARAAWLEALSRALEARWAWGTGAVASELAAGRDPYGESVWAPLRRASTELAAVALASAAELEGDVRTFERLERRVVLALGGVVAAAVAIALAVSWRLSRSLVHPLLSLRAGLMRIGAGEFDTSVELPRGAGRELADIATSMSDMTVALRVSYERLQDQAHRDALTRLPNRRALSVHLEEAFDLVADGGLAVILVDLDDFKDVNDTLGHHAGDELLEVVGRRLSSVVRDGCGVFRLGGDEFAVVVHAADAGAAAVAVAARVLEILGEPAVVAGRQVRVGCSVGIATGRPDAGSADELLRNADAAMYVAKSQGKGRANEFDREMHDAHAARTELKRELGRAVAAEELELHYQPVVDLASGSLVGFEALLRWRHPARGLLPPCDFVPLAEQTGDIVGAGAWALDRACRDLHDLHAALGDHLWVSVNVSGVQLAAGDLVERVRRATSDHQVRPDALVLELTEQVLVDAVDASAVLGELRSLGVRVAIDDFGTGFSSLSYLHDLPLDVLKIDRSFIADDPLAPGDEQRPILDTIVTLARAMDLDVIAEGVERESERSRLAGMGPMAVQGYLIARPVPVGELVEVCEPAGLLETSR